MRHWVVAARSCGNTAPGGPGLKRRIEVNAKQRLSTRVTALKAEVDQFVSDANAALEAQQTRSREREIPVAAPVQPKGGRR